MSVCIVPSDVSQEEAVEWIVLGLEQLLNLSGEIFERLENRTKSLGEHADRVNLDLERVAKKVEQIREMNTAIVISVPSKFIKTENKCQRSVLENGLLTNLKALRRIDRKHRCDSSELKDVAVGFDEKQKFYRFTEKEMRSNRRTREIPDNLKSAADLLLFNTTLNVYTENRFMDPFDNVKIEFHEESESKIQQPAQMADDSALAVSIKQKMDPLQYEPEFDLLDESLVVRKSSGRNSVVEEDINVEEMSTKQNLNRIAEDTKFLTVSENAAVVSQFLTSETSEASSLATKVADLVTSKSESRSFATPNSEKIVPSFPPAAPPPPPPLLPAPSIQLTTQTSTSNQSKPKIALTDGRANLMEAIRRAGGTKGARLRSVRRREEVLAEDASVLPKRNVPAFPSNDDLLSSLAKALEQRRKGIFGKRPEHRESIKSLGLSEGAFAHMSARIPPPPPKEDNDECDDVDEIDDDWE